MSTETAARTNGHKETVKVAHVQEQGMTVTIKAPNFQTAEFKIVGTAPLVVHKFSEKARKQIMQTQEQGKRANSTRKREPKNFDEVYKGAFHVAREDWYGFPAGAFRAAMIAACRATDLKMTQAKIAIFIEADGIDADEGTPLVRIYGTPRKHEAYGRNDDGSVDIRIRPLWETWHIKLRVRYDADMLSIESIANLLARAGLQIGIGEGRPFSKNSTGIGWGTFKLEDKP